MMVKADIREPVIYGVILAVLLGWRATGSLRRRLRGRERMPADRPAII
jgi:sulfoxide reductase heme-binding subunit YedZ